MQTGPQNTLATKFLKPAVPGAIVRDPETRAPLAAEGEDKPFNTYWRRRLAAGDVVEARPAKAAPGATSASKTAAKQES